MNTQKSFVYAAVAISGLLAYCGFLLKDGIRAVDRVEETVPVEDNFTKETFPPINEPIVLRTEPEPEPETEEKAVSVLSPQSNVPETVTEPPAEHVFSPIWPVKGEVTASFSSKLTYSEAGGDWRAHTGIDIAAKKTERVLAAESGTVRAVYDDPLFGKTIEIEHGEYKTVYKNLSTLVMAHEGDTVEKGDAISGVGEGAAFEKIGGAHLHFEILKDGEYIDPFTLLDKTPEKG